MRSIVEVFIGLMVVLLLAWLVTVLIPAPASIETAIWIVALLIWIFWAFGDSLSGMFRR